MTKLIVNKFANAKRGVTQAGKRAAMKLALAMETEIKNRMSEPASGVMYGNHQASAPGDPPAVDTGALRASVISRETDTGASVSSHMEYAPLLELGTSVMAPRPVWVPVAQDVSQRAVTICRDAVPEALRDEGLS